MLRQVEQSEGGVRDSDAQVHDDIGEALAQSADGSCDQLGRDLIRLFGAQSAWQDHRPARVVKDRAQQHLFKRCLWEGRHPGKTAGGHKPREQRRMRVGKIQVKQEDLSRVTPR